MPVPNVQWITPEDGQRNCPKHVEFRTRINLEMSASVGFYCKAKSKYLVQKTTSLFFKDFRFEALFVQQKKMFIDFPITTTLQIIAYSFIHHVHYEMFRPVMAAIIG